MHRVESVNGKSGVVTIKAADDSIIVNSKGSFITLQSTGGGGITDGGTINGNLVINGNLSCASLSATANIGIPANPATINTVVIKPHNTFLEFVCGGYVLQIPWTSTNDETEDPPLLQPPPPPAGMSASPSSSSTVSPP